MNLTNKVNKKKTIHVALVGNPNVGKSVIFNYLTNSYVDVSNYPGTTIDVSRGLIKLSEKEQANISYNFELVDTPGIYSVSNLCEEETAARDFILTADIIVNVLSAVSLNRDLFLCKQLADMGKPMIAVLNQFDEVRKRNLDIDTVSLSEYLGLEILEASAIKKQGLAELKEIVINFADNAKIRPGKISKAIDNYSAPYQELVLDRATALLIAEADADLAKKNDILLPQEASSRRKEIYDIRNQEVEELVSEYVTELNLTWTDHLGDWILNPVIGSVIATVIVYSFLFLFLGSFVAGTIVDFLEQSVFKAYYEPFVRNIVSFVFPIEASTMSNLVFTKPLTAIGTLLAGDYGILTLTITYLYALLMPLVLGFYFGLALLEDSGYLPRLAVLTDGVLSSLGMNGRAVIPLILGGGCVTMATVTTRLLSTEKEKLITMALLGLTIPCSAQLGVIQGLLTNIGGFVPWLIWGGTLLTVFIITGYVMNKLVPGDCGHFISDIPPLRLPELNNVFQKTWTRSKIFLDEATPAFFTAAALVASLQITGLLQGIIDFCEPLMHSILLLPKEVTLSFILGMVRRDFGAFGLMDIALSSSQLITVCVVLTLFVPCIATVAVMVKEKNLKTAAAIWLSSWALALGIGAVLARVLLILD
ncbi:MAG: ferrous iron transport protein B [Candidatus Caenarcaniphilales bacterium]|nr:ferrous iron transport protein B [Candidatus Caenarcaniphilales bacterium]